MNMDNFDKKIVIMMADENRNCPFCTKPRNYKTQLRIKFTEDSWSELKECKECGTSWSSRINCKTGEATLSNIVGPKEVLSMENLREYYGKKYK